ncbi:hypothetical protein ACLQ2Q_07105 [Microbacterium sp. DT81.1]|uniref:hypothetical protein n=1 Tax=Microbacterium sp. DT81.1 TaxID=3393413 RepID=UPI003CF81FB2
MTYPVDFVTGVSCVGEGVHVVGEVTYLVQAVEPSSGDLLIAYHMRTDVTGLGVASGTSYTVVDSRRGANQFRGPYRLDQSSVATSTLLLVSRGEGPNFILTLQDKVTVTADGEVAVEFLNTNVHCVG